VKKTTLAILRDFVFDLRIEAKSAPEEFRRSLAGARSDALLDLLNAYSNLESSTEQIQKQLASIFNPVKESLN